MVILYLLQGANIHHTINLLVTQPVNQANIEQELKNKEFIL